MKTHAIPNCYWSFGSNADSQGFITYDGYPAWICDECAQSRGHRNQFQASTYHEDVCGWCEQMKAVTQPRDFGYPKYSKK